MAKNHPGRALKLAAAVVALVGAVVFFVLAPMMMNRVVLLHPSQDVWLWPSLLYIWLIGGVCYVALWHFWKICVQIGRDRSFCMENASSLRWISLLTVLIGGLLALGAGALVLLEMTSLLLILGMGLAALAAWVVALMAYALSHLVKKAAHLQNENDLTI